MSTVIRRPRDDEEEGRRPLHLQDVLRRRRWWGALAFAGSFAAVVAVAVSLPDVYSSGATILIERQQIPADLVRSTVTSGLDVRLQTISQEILSRSRLEGLISQFGLYPEARGRTPMEQVVEGMRKDVQVEMRGEQKRSDQSTVAFSVSYRGSDPARVAAVTNAIASFYIEENLKARERQATGTADFMRNQLDQAKSLLAEQEAQVSAFKEKYLGELPEQLDANLKTLEQLNAQLRLNSDNQVQATARKSALETQFGEALGLAGGGPDALGLRLAQLRKQLADLQAQYTEQYPDVVRVKKEIERLEAQAAAGGADPQSGGVALSPQALQVRQALADADLELKRLRLEADRLRAAIALYQKRVEAAPKREQEFQALSREYKSTQEQYRSLLGRQNEAELAESMEQRQKGEIFRVIEPAVPDQQPAAPKRARILLLGFLLSLALAGAVVFVREAFDSTVHGREDVETSATLPVLASVPVLRSERDAGRRRLRFALEAALALASLSVVFTTSYLLARGNVAFAVWVSK